jgi:hypothetical protein
MKLMKPSVVLLVFGFGCVAAKIAEPLVIPPAFAGTDPPKWEQYCVTYERVPKYMVTDVDHGDGWNAVLKGHGQQGWEVVALVTSPQGAIDAVCFKRPL